MPQFCHCVSFLFDILPSNLLHVKQKRIGGEKKKNNLKWPSNTDLD